MITLDEVITGMTELILSGKTADVKSTVRDALHYLKEYRTEQNILSDSKEHYEYWEHKYYAELEKNDPLSWDELKGMEGMPVWVEERLMIDGKERHDNRWFLVGKVTDKYMDGTDLEAELRYMRCDYAFDFPEHSHWQAYRKERTNEG